MKRVAILQSNYIPWKGYFDMIAHVDEFILYDDMQYTRRDWRNRNKIKTNSGVQWLTVPVKAKGQFHQRIRDVELSDVAWAADHWKSLTHAYGRSRYFQEVASWAKPLYLEKSFTHLSNLNRAFLEKICEVLSIQTPLVWSWKYNLADGKTDRLVSLCQQAGATEYVTGPAAKDYIQEDLFTKAGIQVCWFDYSGYTEYPQLWGDFVHEVSILDLLFNCGPDSAAFMKFVRSQ